MIKRPVRKEFILALAIAAMAAGLAVTFYRTFDQQMLREREFRENPVWVTSQADHELQQLIIALRDFAEGNAGVRAEDVQVQFDILWSRIDLLKKDSTGQLLTNTGEVGTAVRAAERILHRMEPQILNLTEADRQKAGALDRELRGLTATMHAATVATNVAHWVRYAEERGKVRGDLGLAVALALGVFAAGGVLLVIAVRETRSSRRLAAQYEGAMGELTLARDELEFRVAERTRALSMEIAERRRTEVELRESEDRYRRVVESIPDALWILRNGIIVLANNACARLVGAVSPDDLIGRNALEFVHKDDLAQVRGRMAEALASGSVPPREIRMIGANGNIVHTEAVGLATTYKGETAVMSVLRDLSDRKAAEAELRRGEARLQQALEASGDGVWDWDIVAGTVLRSRRSAEIMGMSPTELGEGVGAWNARVHPDDRAEHDRSIQACLDGDIPTLRIEYRIRALDGGWVWVLSQGKVVERDAEGRPLRMIGSIREMTARRKAEDELRALKEQAESANAAKNKFLANMSHELRTPLNAILGFTEAMRMELAGPIGNAAYKGYVEDIHDSGTHLLELIADLLDISAIESGAFRLNEAIIDIPTLTSGCLRLLKPRADAAGVRLDDGGFDIGAMPVAPALRADERRSRQILLNALTNALRRTPQGGRVALRTRLDQDGTLVFEVEDDGAALSAADVARALDMQGPGMGDPGRVPGGPGLGLPLGRTLTEAHGGSMTLVGSQGHGNVATIRFPVDRVLLRDARPGGFLRLV